MSNQVERKSAANHPGRNAMFQCGHRFQVNAPDFDPAADAEWCAKYDCPPCRKAANAGATTQAA